MRKFYVIAKKWDNQANQIIEYVAGEFNDYPNANLFKNAYNDRYSVDAYIKEIELF